MFRPPTTASGTSSNPGGAKSLTASNAPKQTLPQQSQHSGHNNHHNSENASPTIREIRSRTLSSVSNNNARNLLANRRQTMSMDRLNCGTSSIASNAQSNHNDKEKNSPSGSCSSINSSPLRTGGLNRTASRVSRFRSAKAVFEKLSSSSNSNAGKIDRSALPEKPRGTVASRYAAATAARALTNQSSNNLSSRSRFQPGALARSQDSGRSTSNIEINRFNQTPKSTNETISQPKPQPRVVASKTNMALSTVSNATGAVVADRNKIVSNPATPSKNSTQAKPPPKDLIDKIVLEIALDAGKQDPDPNCTIQDLSNCDISGIPETLDFDRCFQDVEMMTEEEARKLLSRKPEVSQLTQATDNNQDDVTADKLSRSDSANDPSIVSTTDSNVSHQDSSPDLSKTSTSRVNKCKVRFSDDPVTVYNTHAIEDYDRRNDDIDPVAASAEYEIEKSMERECSQDSDNDDGYYDFKTAKSSDQLKKTTSEACQNSKSSPQNISQDSSVSEQKSDEDDSGQREYVESLEREINLKRILEQNLRDLQSQYYEAVKQLDEHKGTSESELSKLDEKLAIVKAELESSKSEVADTREQSNQLEQQLNEVKESSQVLDKKYHRAKKIIKDMQSREQSFNRREQLYQQKLDEIEYELGMLIESIDKTIHDDGHKFYKLVDATDCHVQHQTQLDVFGLIKQMLINFSANQSTQNRQIKQRVLAILEQQLANLMVSTNGNTTTVDSVPIMTSSATLRGMANDNSQHPSQSNDKHSQSYQFASHRLSQPNLPHPIGVGGQPTKLFHGINPVPVPIQSTNEPSPPQSVNSYPSTNSLNSLNINNNNNNFNSLNKNNNLVAVSKLREQSPISDLQFTLNSVVPSTTATSTGEDKFRPATDIQIPFQTNEWHDKPVSEWTTTQVSTWLLALGLDQYISKFEDRNVNGQSLINLDSTLLKGLGVLNSNDRNLLKKKIRELRVEMEKELKLFEKKMKGNLKDKNKFGKSNVGSKNDKIKTDLLKNKPSWKKGLLS